MKLRTLDYVGIAFALLATVFSVSGLLQMESNTEDVLQWLPDQSEARDDYNFLSDTFGSDDFVIVTWEGCTVHDPRLVEFVTFIRTADDANLIQSIISGREVASRLSTQFELPQSSIARRMKGVFFGTQEPDLTCSIIELSDKGTANRIDAMKFVEAAIEQVPGLPREQVSIAGYAYIATFIDRKLKDSLRIYLVPSVLLASLMSLICLRNLNLSLIVFVTAAGSSAVSIACIPILGAKLGGLMTIIPALVFVLSTSGSIHLIRYGLSAIGDAKALIKIGWKPCTVSTLTTAVGMLSLTRSDFPAIRDFGFFCSIGVAFALAFQLIMVPWLLTRFGQPGLQRLAMRREESLRWQHLMVFVCKYRTAITLACAALMVWGAVGLAKLHAQVEVEKLFRDDSALLRSISDFEDRFGPIDQTEILMVFKNPDPQQFPDRVNYVRQVQAAVTRIPGVAITHSLINYLPREPIGDSARDFFRKSTYRNLLKRERTNLANENLLCISPSREIWRVSLRFPFSNENDFPRLARDVEQTASAVELPVFKSGSFQQPKITYTGKTHLFNHAQLTLLSDLFQNFLLAFLIITPILILVLRSIRLGLIAMLPNIFPTLIAFGGMGWLGVGIDLSIAMTACVALGIAVDDTTHFLIRFRDYGGNLHNILLPVQRTIGQCGPAMLYTTLIASCSLMVYFFGDLLVVARFATTISILLLIALLADVLMLPAILYLFVPRDQKMSGACGKIDQKEDLSEVMAS